MYEIPRMGHKVRAFCIPPEYSKVPMGKTLRRFFLLFLLAVVSAQTFQHVAPAWADDDGGEGGDGGDSDGGDGGDGGDSGGSDSDGGDGGDGGTSDDGASDGDGYNDDDDDQEQARAGRVSGTYLPLNTILRKVRRRYPGTILKVRLKRRGGTAYYEIRILDRRDRVRTVTVPAGPRRKGNWTSRR